MSLAAPDTEEEKRLASMLDVAYDSGWSDARDAAVAIVKKLLDHSDNRVSNAAFALIVALESELKID